MLTPEEQDELERLRREHIPIRAIARRLGRDVKTIRRALGRPPHPPAAPPPPSKLAPFQALAKDFFDKDLRSPRILRELRARGYTGGLTILKAYLQTLGPRRPRRPVFRRFETAPGVEAQSDWSPYRVTIAGRETIVHAFAMVLGSSRRNFVAFFRDERLPTLLWAHREAFRYHGGVCQRIAYDNQTAITLGRVGGRPRWHPDFLAFARHYGFEPSVGRPRHKERRGKVERPFYYLEEDFLRARTFASWDDLRAQVRRWLDTVANVRVHGTTRRLVDEAYAEERPCLIALPAVVYPAERRETRIVQKAGLVPVDGSYYPAPGQPVGATVTVHIDPMRVAIVDAAGARVATHAVPAQPTRLPSPPLPPGRPDARLSRATQETRFLARFPDAVAFLDGLNQRMTTLTPIHLHALDRLANLYGEQPVRDALAVATAYRNFNARAIERILQRAHPTVVLEPAPAVARPEALGALDDVEPGSPQDYTLDSMPATGGGPDGA
jgi:transposase